MGGSRRTPVSRLVPGLTGRGVLLASPADVEAVRANLAADGVALAEVAGATDAMRPTQAAIARALRLPETAGRNLDALVDALRDLAVRWPDDERVVLLWHDAGRLVDADLPGFLTLTEILRTAAAELGPGGRIGDRQFETVAFVERHGVRTIAEASR
ncbi:barstar family protein [Pseudonocardia kunmingensis]|uniref:barstar family protein n=1 Tax=Pseudonocardia kunmingensis TaxID=630975 RepID=UPI001478D969|nr:barstar family protein [Pseudonocardia kunmingensis]